MRTRLTWNALTAKRFYHETRSNFTIQVSSMAILSPFHSTKNYGRKWFWNFLRKVSKNLRIYEFPKPFNAKKPRIYKFPKPFKAKIRGDMFSKTQAYIARFSFSFFGTYLKILFYSLRKVLRIQTGRFGRPLASPICEKNADRQQIKTKTTRTTATCHPNDRPWISPALVPPIPMAVIILFAANLAGVSRFFEMNF